MCFVKGPYSLQGSKISLYAVYYQQRSMIPGHATSFPPSDDFTAKLSSGPLDLKIILSTYSCGAMSYALAESNQILSGIVVA